MTDTTKRIKELEDALELLRSYTAGIDDYFNRKHALNIINSALNIKEGAGV